MSKIGERLGADDAASQYIKHPSGGWLTDGDPLDAGSAHILDNNLSHLSHESPRHLFWQKGPGVRGAKADPRGYDDIPGVHTQTSYEAWRQIAWTSTVCRMFGPFALVVDRLGTTGYTPRAIHVRAKVSAAGSNTNRMYAALMPGTSNPWDGGALIFRTVANGATTGVQLFELDLAMEFMTAPITETWVGREGGSRVMHTRVMPCSVWVGWYQTDNADALYSIAGYEVR